MGKKKKEWHKVIDFKPSHKDLVLCWNGNMTLPAIYYNNQTFNGFYKFTSYYHTHVSDEYRKTKLKEKHKIKNIIKWKPMEVYNEQS